MTFPVTPLDLSVELYLRAAWTDVTNDVYIRDGVRISRGRPNESRQTPPQTCQLTLNNASRNYSSRNPVGAYYGSLGRNTPLRVAVHTAKDSFTRTVASGWGTADAGGAWATTGVGGSVLASDFNVSGGVGTHSVPATNGYRLTYLGGQLYRDVDVAATVSGLPANITGAAIEPLCLILGGLSITNYFLAPITISAAEVVSVAITHFDGTILVAPTVVPMTYTGQSLRARFQLDGHTLRAKVWPAASGEPYAWNVEISSGAVVSTYLRNRAPGWVGIRSGIATGNTNTKPVIFSYDSLDVRSNRFAGEVSAWPAKWDLSGKDVYTPIQASGMTRRLSQGDSPTASAFYRAFTTLAVPPIVYWPMEDGKEATEIASGIGGAPLTIRGAPKLASNSDFVTSDAIPVVNGAQFGDWYSINGALNTGTIQTTFLLSVPGSGDTNNFAFIQIQNAGSATYWNVKYEQTLSTGGGISIECFDRGGGTLLATTSAEFHFKGHPVWCSLELVQNGTGIDWAFVTLEPGADLGGFINGNLAGNTLGALTAVKVNPDGGLINSAIGHVMSRNYYGSLFGLETYLVAYAGETTRERIARLSAENGVPFGYLYNGKSNSTLIGTQAKESYSTLIAEAADSDMGVLYESRSHSALVYRVRNTNYNQSAALALDYSLDHLAPPFEPTEDDQGLANDVTVTRTGGSSVRVQKTTGPLAVSDPFSASGAGRYDTSISQSLYRDSQLPDAAGWVLHLGTVDEARYPTLTVNLAKLAGGNPQLYRDALGVDVGGRITIDNPKTGFDPNQLDQLVQGYREWLSSFQHTLTFNCTPGSPYRVLKADTPGSGAVSSGTSSLTSGVTSTATALSVTTTNSRDLWRTGVVSIPISIAGENMLCTNVSGATSPQTFTVTRSTNGVVKAQSAGASVRLTRRSTVAL